MKCRIHGTWIAMQCLALFLGASLDLLVQPSYAAELGASALDLPMAQPVDNVGALVEKEFERHDAEYRAQRRKFSSMLQPLRERLFSAQRTGNAMDCSSQIASEAKWLLRHTTQWARLQATIDRLESSLADVDQTFALAQSPENGAWGICYREWFLKLNATIDALNDLARTGKAPKYPLSFLERVGDADKLIHKARNLLVSDIAKTGMDRRDELNELIAAMAQLIFKPDLRAYVDRNVRGFKISDEMADRYRAFLDLWQDATSGYWGAFYHIGTRIYRGQDVSITFHVVSYRHGRVHHWPEIIDTTLAIKAFEYPYGWLTDNAYNDHNNYDISKIFHYGWPHMSTMQKRSVSREIGAMVDWWLAHSVHSDGSLRPDSDFYNTLEDRYYYALSFLEIIGYWDPSKRFWTERRFPHAQRLCRDFKSKLQRLVHDSVIAREAMERLPADCKAVP